MKLKKSFCFIIGISCVYLPTVFRTVSDAQHETLLIKNVKVQLVETRPPIESKVIHVYNIIAVLYNSGDIKSNEITVYFYDPEYNKTTTPPIKLTPFNVSLNPNENKTFILQYWPTPLSGDVPLNISFKPSSPNVLVTRDNSGSYVYILRIGNGEKPTSTSGFEVAIVLLVILVFLLPKQIRK